MGIGLSHPVTSKVLYRKGSRSYRLGAAQMQGWRENMEDAHAFTFELSHHSNAAFFGVFDGHAGNKCSPYAAEHLPNYLDNVSNWEDEQGIINACLDCDDAFLSDQRFLGQEDGSTAIFTMVTPNESNLEFKVICGNIGDSRAVLGKLNPDNTFTTITLSHDHKPTDPQERDRIVAAGGMVQIGRVDGQLALSRAFGDRALKVPMHGDRSARKVCAVPDIIVETAKPGDFLFIACDGIYESDVFSRESVVEFIASKLKQTDDLAQICAQVLDACLNRGSKDNMTAVLIQFTDGVSYSQAKDEYVPGPYYANKDGKKFQEAYKADAEASGYSLEEALRLLATNALKKAEADSKAESTKIGGPTSSESPSLSDASVSNNVISLPASPPTNEESVTDASTSSTTTTEDGKGDLMNVD
jgi:serine/threonine protein phosphatase PrpC